MFDHDAALNTYSFRAEYQHDFDRFLEIAIQSGHTLSIKRVLPNIGKGSDGQAFDTGEVLVEFTTRSKLEHLLKDMDYVQDGHVMRQTLRPVPLSENSTERDFSRE